MKTFHFHTARRFSVAFVAFGWCLTFCSAVAVSQENLDFPGVLELPQIVRYSDLPRRMLLEPEISLPADIPYIKDSTWNLFERMLVSAPDNEILIEAIRSLERVQISGLADVSHVGELLHGHLLKTDNDLVKQACASALATIGRSELADDVAQVCIPRYEALCLKIEPGFCELGGGRSEVDMDGSHQQPGTIFGCADRTGL